MHDPLSDMCTRIRNGYMARKTHIEVRKSIVVFNVLSVFVDNGYLDDVTNVIVDDIGLLQVKLKYHGNAPALKRISRVSRLRNRVYVKYRDIRRICNGEMKMGLMILSTSCGIKSGHDAARECIGGEYICSVF